MTRKKWKQLLKAKLSVETLEMQREHYRAQAEFLELQLAKAEARAERAEQRLHQVTMTMSEISQNALSASTKSTVSEVLMDGRSILRLNNPIGPALVE